MRTIYGQEACFMHLQPGHYSYPIYSRPEVANDVISIVTGAVWMALQISHRQSICRDFQIEHTAFRLALPTGGLLVQHRSASKKPWLGADSRAIQTADLLACGISWSTRSSPQWWSCRSMTAHIVLDLRSLIWLGLLAKAVRLFMASLHSQSVFSNVPSVHFRRSTTGWLKSEKGTFWPPVWMLGAQESGMGPFDSPPIVHSY